jgi:hypothetical protein
MKTVFLNTINPVRIGLIICMLVLLIAGTATTVHAQFENKWLSVGSMHNWYSEIGSEREHGNQAFQQFGLRWPAIYAYQDMQAYKAFWIGTTNFTDQRGDFYTYKVVHVGPRVTGAQSFTPIEFNLISRFDPPIVFVDGLFQFGEAYSEVDEVDPSIPADRILYNKFNSHIGVTVERTIMQFSQDFHDNYHLMEYVFTNTGNINADPTIELPTTTLEDVYFFFFNRYSVLRQTRYLIGNATGWGINTMIDSRGDGVMDDPPDQWNSHQMRSIFSWHGKYPPFTAYDNLGAPIFSAEQSAGYVEPEDTVGRLGAAHFVGWVTIHADRSPNDPTDDPSQPSTTFHLGSDEPETSANDPYNVVRMEREYSRMRQGHANPRHAYIVEPQGNFTNPTGDPSLGTPGGFSAAVGYGPYTLAPGESVRIVVAEGASGLSRENAIEIGNQFKRGVITNVQKNEWVMSSRDSLFQTFRRAVENYESGYNIPRPPLPPKSLEVNSGGDRIVLEWDIYDEPDPSRTGFEIWRATGRFDSTYYLIHQAGPAERRYEDTAPIRGQQYFYYIVTVGDPTFNNGTALTPPGPLKSSRYYTQTYDPAFLRRPAGETMDEIRIVPNPYNLGSSERVRWDIQDRIGFLNIPGECTIRIYTELGELVRTIEHTDGSGDEFWDLTTSSRQVVVSGIYIAVIDNHETGQRAIKKFVIIR